MSAITVQIDVHIRDVVLVDKIAVHMALVPPGGELARGGGEVVQIVDLRIEPEGRAITSSP